VTPRARAVGGWIGQVLIWTFILGVGAVLILTVAVPRLAGAVPYTVLTGSMRPDIPEGSLVVVKPADPATIGVGQVVTYQLESGKSASVTHRVTEVSQAINGDRLFVTQGDANDVPDPDVVRAEQIVGVLWYELPYLGYVNQLINGDLRQVVLGVVVTGLVAYAAFMFVGSLRDRRRRAEAEPETQQGRAPVAAEVQRTE
jgi:signal peptidase